MTQLRSFLPYGITQCCLLPDTSEHTPPTPAMQAGTRFTYPGGMEGWVDLVDSIAPRPGVEPATFRSRVRRRTAAPPRFYKAVWLYKLHHNVWQRVSGLCPEPLESLRKGREEKWGLKEGEKWPGPGPPRFMAVRRRCHLAPAVMWGFGLRAESPELWVGLSHRLELICGFFRRLSINLA